MQACKTIDDISISATTLKTESTELFSVERFHFDGICRLETGTK